MIEFDKMKNNGAKGKFEDSTPSILNEYKKNTLKKSIIHNI